MFQQALGRNVARDLVFSPALAFTISDARHLTRMWNWKVAEANFGSANLNDERAVSFIDSSVEIKNLFRWGGHNPAEIFSV